MNKLMFPLSWGEALDRGTILAIKVQMIKDKDKLRKVIQEWNDLQSIFDKAILNEIFTMEQLNDSFRELNAVNLELWDIEDRIRIKERDQEFDDEFIELARSVYKVNDQRFTLKNKFNQLVGSHYQEQKEYVDYANDSSSGN